VLLFLLGFIDILCGIFYLANVYVFPLFLLPLAKGVWGLIFALRYKDFLSFLASMLDLLFSFFAIFSIRITLLGALMIGKGVLSLF